MPEGLSSSAAPTPMLSVCRALFRRRRRRGVCPIAGSAVEHRHRLHRANPNKSSATQPGAPDPHRRALWPRWRPHRHGRPTRRRRPGRARSRTSGRTPRNDPTPPWSHVWSVAHDRSTPPPPTPNDPQQRAHGCGGRSPRRRRRPSPAPAAPTSPHRTDRPGHTPPHRPSTVRRSPRRHHDPPSPNPFDHERSTKGKPDENNPKQGM
jgi:hypothetical protein